MYVVVFHLGNTSTFTQMWFYGIFSNIHPSIHYLCILIVWRVVGICI